MGLNDIHNLAHSKWNCKYHIEFAPKYRRMAMYGRYKIAIEKILRQLCEWKGVNILEAEVCPDPKRKKKKLAECTQLTDRITYCTDGEEQGLCPNEKNPRSNAGIIILYDDSL